jgi:ArsR family transcriptional regulator, lead/cadmium/zinc/bismuth-responsive transcriptional repressor
VTPSLTDVLSREGPTRYTGEPAVIFRTVKKLATSQARVVPLDRCEVECVEPERVAEVLVRLPDAAVFQDLAETFRVLSDPGRVRLISALLEAGELCVCDLAAVTGLSQTACSHNLRLLRSSRLVRYRKQGRNVYYALDDAHIRLLLDVALQHVAYEKPAQP